MATKRTGAKVQKDKFTWQKGDVQIYKNEAEYRAAVAKEKREAAKKSAKK